MNVERLGKLVPVSLAAAERVAHARDLWPRGTLALAGAGPLSPCPDAVAWPRNEDEIALCLQWAATEGVAIVPYGAGSGVCGAAAGRSGSLVLDLKRMNRIGAIDGDTVRCEPGVLGQHLEDALERVGRATRHSPSSIWCSTVGGWAASRSAGQFSSKYGKFEDMVLGLRVVAPAARFGTGVWAAGPDLGSWVMGSEGALGVISELLIRTVPLPRVRRFGAWRFASVESAWDAMRALLQADLHPAVLRMYDPVDTRLAGKGTATKAADAGAGWLKELGRLVESVPSLRRHMLALPLALPRLLNALAQGLSSGCVLIVGWEGEPEIVDVLSRHGAALLTAGEPLGEEPGEHWYAHRHEVSYKSAPIFEKGGFADTMEVATTWTHLPELYAGVRAALGRHALVMAHFSHVYREGCSIYFSFAGVGRLDVYDAAWGDALAAASAAHGTVAHHHGVGQLKMHAAARELAGISERFHELKAHLDPLGVLNPGRLFPPVDVPEPAALPAEVDSLSLVATLPAQQSAVERDRWLAERGWELRFPTSLSLAASVALPREPWETRVLGGSAQLGGRRAVFVAVPRSSAGPDPRASLPPETYEMLTVPVVRLGEPSTRVDTPWSLCVAADLRPSRNLGDSVEFRGPAGPALAERAARLTGVATGSGREELP